MVTRQDFHVPTEAAGRESGKELIAVKRSNGGGGSSRPVRYGIADLQPGETHFVKGSSAHAVQSYLSHVRRRYGIAKGAVIRAVDSRTGVIIRREA